MKIYKHIYIYRYIKIHLFVYLCLFIYMYVAHLRTLFLPVALQSVTCCDRVQSRHHQKKNAKKKHCRPYRL